MNNLMLIVLFSNVCFLVKAQSSESASSENESSEYESSGFGSSEFECRESFEAASTALNDIFKNKEELDCVEKFQLAEQMLGNSTCEEDESCNEKLHKFYESLDEEGKVDVLKCIIDQGNIAIGKAGVDITEECKTVLEEHLYNFLSFAESEEEE